MQWLFSNSGNGVIDDTYNRANNCNAIDGNTVLMVIVAMRVTTGVPAVLESSEFA